MAGSQTYQPETFYDLLTSFEAGCNSGVEPILLPKNQLAFGLNTSCRGAYVTHRPPILKKRLVFTSPLVEHSVKKGFFQGAGYYRPDYGTQLLIAQISGHLYKFTEAGDIWTVADISVPNDFNNASTSQVWMWQAERWMIIQNGTQLPIFFDGTNSRRSYGPSVVLATTAAPFTPPAIGSTVTLTLAAAYTGPYNVPVILNKAFYQPVTSSVGYPAILKNINNVPGTLAKATNNQFIVQPPPVTSSVKTLNAPDISAMQLNVNNLAPVTGGAVFRHGYSVYLGSHVGTFFTSAWYLPPNSVITVQVDNPFTGGVGTLIHLGMSQNYTIDGNNGTIDDMGDPGYFPGSAVWHVDAISPDSKTLTLSLHNEPGTGNPLHIPGAFIFGIGNYIDNNGGNHNVTAASKLFIPSGQVIQSTTVAPPFPIGKLTQDAVLPGANGTVQVLLDRAYTGAANQLVTWGSFQFEISPAPNPAPSTSLIVINLTDVTSAPVANPVDMLSVPELPAGRMGVYGMGRNWMSLTDGISFIGGDIVGGPAGTPANNFRDSVLKTTENDFLSGGGSFRLPGTGETITAMIFTANLDQSLGQGPLQVGTSKSVFSNNAPVDRSVWKNMTNPILTESLIGTGPLAQNSTQLVNSDTFFRSDAGLASLILARRDFTGWGNTPISQEMRRVIQLDNTNLLPYGSAINFDNRYLHTVSPNVSGQGVFHVGLIAMNFDTISNLRTKLPPIYDGVWSGVNALQMLSGAINGSNRSFAFTFNVDTNEIELWEFLKEATAAIYDDNTIPILWSFETPVAFNKDVKRLTQYCRLWNGELYLKEIIGKVDIEVQYRPDFYPCWVSWRKFSLCADKNKDTVQNSQPGYRTPVGLGEPSVDDCEAGNNRPLRNGYFFQFRVVITGHCKFMGMRVAAVSEPQPEFAAPVCDDVCEASV